MLKNYSVNTAYNVPNEIINGIQQQYNGYQYPDFSKIRNYYGNQDYSNVGQQVYNMFNNSMYQRNNNALNIGRIIKMMMDYQGR